MQVTPKNVFSDFENNLLDKNYASELLMTLIENSKEDDVRAESIEYLKKIDCKQQKIFEFLENLLVSDLSEAIRSAAFQAISKNFTKKAIKPVIYAIFKEKG